MQSFYLGASRAFVIHDAKLGRSKGLDTRDLETTLKSGLPSYLMLI